LDKLPSGPVLVFAPHPDDEVIGVGGTLGLHAQQGDCVHVVVAFDGALGLASRDPQDACTTRQREARAAGEALSAGDASISYQFLGLPEGHDPTPGELQQGATRLAQILIERQATSLYAPWPGDAHRDHRSLAQALALALEQIPASQRPAHRWGYEVWSTLEPTALVDVTCMTARKRAALACHVSQGPRELTRRALGLSAWRSAHMESDQRHAEALCPFPLWGSAGWQPHTCALPVPRP